MRCCARFRNSATLITQSGPFFFYYASQYLAASFVSLSIPPVTALSEIIGGALTARGVL